MADHAEMEGQVSHALARQSNSVEEWRLAIRQKDAQMQSELEMLSSSVEDLREKLISSQAELRVRLTGLEIRGDGLASGREPCDAEGAYMAQSLEFLKQHVDRLQQGSIHAGAALSELQARVEGEAAARAAAQQEHTSRLEALNQALGFSRALMAQSIAQRVEALEERFGNERQELFARHQRLQHEVASEGQEGSAKMQELAARVANSIVALEKRCLGMETSQQELETHLAETVKAYRSEGSMIKGALAALSKKTEETTVSRHSEGVKTFKSQVETSLRQLRELVEVERRARLQDNKRLCDEVTEAAQKAVTADLTTLHSALKKQAENVTIEMDRIRRVNADRADRLSRYVDVALKDAGILPDQSPGRRQAAAEDARLLRDLREQFIALQKELNEQVQGLEQKSSEISEELRSKFARQADWQEDEAKALRREAEQAARDVERRAFCRQEELETRFETSAAMKSVCSPPRF
ncbi:Hypothetical protein (Fragment) [Durusdinium trenchii]|uniref:Uncharacterized protein n=1 Tax=Durusdinium trenchii TaxID=1381693 RepID=A0ABP0IHZ0_9DINO